MLHERRERIFPLKECVSLWFAYVSVLNSQASNAHPSLPVWWSSLPVYGSSFNQFILEEMVLSRWSAGNYSKANVVTAASPWLLPLPRRMDWWHKVDSYDNYWSTVCNQYSSEAAIVVTTSYTFGYSAGHLHYLMLQSLLRQPSTCVSRIIWCSIDAALSDEFQSVHRHALDFGPRFVSLPYPTISLHSIPPMWQEHRDVLLVLQVSIDDNKARVDHNFRQMLIDGIVAKGGRCIRQQNFHACWICFRAEGYGNPRSHCSEQRMSNASFWQRLQTATFSLEPGGDTPTRSEFYAAIASGSVPVLFDYAHQEIAGPAAYPWRLANSSLFQINYSKFSERFDSREIRRGYDWVRSLRRTYRAAANKRYQMREILPYFFYDSTGHFDCYDIFLQELSKMK